MASPICTVNDLATTNGVDVLSTDTILIQLASTAGVDLWELNCIGTDETEAGASAINAALAFNHVTRTATLAARGAEGKALIFESIVTSGRTVSRTTLGVYVRTVAGLRVGALNETSEGSSIAGWTPKINEMIRATTGYIRDTATTENNTPTMLGDGITVPEDSAATFDVEVRAWTLNGSKRAKWRLSLDVSRRETSAAVVNGTVVTALSKGSNSGAPPAGWNAELVLTGNVVQVRGTGESGTSVFWLVKMDYEADDLDTDGSVPDFPSGVKLSLDAVDLTDGAVASWNDVVNSHNFAQATGGNRPVKGSSPLAVTYDGAGGGAGAGDYLSCNDTIVTGGFVFGCLFKFNTVPTSISDFQVLATLKVGSFYFAVAFVPDAAWGELVFCAQCGTSSIKATITLDTNWHSLFISWGGGDFTNAGTYAVELDGTPVSPSAIASVLPGTSGVIGAFPDGSFGFKGAQDCVRMYDFITGGDLAAFKAALAGRLATKP
jgi:hypothetical protein